MSTLSRQLVGIRFQRDRQKDHRVPTKKWGGRNLLIHRGGGVGKKMECPLTTSRSKTRASPAWAYLDTGSNPFIKRPSERTANNTLPQKLANHCITSSSSFSECLFEHDACAFILVPGSLALQHTRWPRKVSNILRAPIKFSRDPTEKTFQTSFTFTSRPQKDETNLTHTHTCGTTI